MPGVFQFSKIAASNAGACPTINWTEGMAPSAVNDSSRAEMAAVAAWRDDISGAIVTTGTSAAFIVASNQIFDTLAHFHGQMIAFAPHVTNAAGPVTVTVDGFANLPLRSSPGVELMAGVLIAGTPYICSYNNTDGALYLQGFFGSSPYLIPLGGMIDYIGSTTPGAAYAFPQGQAISRTTYATLFALVGTTYGPGDGSTTFNLIDMTGRVGAMKEAVATRLTAAGFGGNSANLGAVGGLETEALSLGHLPTGITSANASQTINLSASPGTQFPVTSFGGLVAIAPPSVVGGPTSYVVGAGGGLFIQNPGSVVNSISVTSTNTGSQAAGGAKNVPTVQPTIIVNKILRVL